jgi:hypothetical protein
LRSPILPAGSAINPPVVGTPHCCAPLEQNYKY